jgi:hypothetical protein
MNCEKFRANLVTYVEGLLKESARQTMEEHLKDCSDCRAELSEVSSLRARLLENGNRFAGVDYENDVMNRIVREQSFKLRRVEKTKGHRPIGRLIMSSKITRLAAAAVIIIGVLVGLNVILSGGGGGVAIGEVLSQVENIQNVMYRMTAKMVGLPGIPAGTAIDIDSVIKLSYEYEACYVDSTIGIPGKATRSKAYILFGERIIYSLMPNEKKYIEMTLTEDLITKMEQENGDPLTLLKAMVECEYTDLGHDTINGIDVWGIEVADPELGSKMGSLASGGMFDEVVVQLWVDVKTKLPVSMSLAGSAKKGEVSMDMLIDDFQWGVEVDAAEFEPNIPDDYELLGQGELGIGDEGAEIIEVLELFTEYSHGKYPSSLAGLTVALEFTEALQIEFAKNPPPPGGPPKELIERVVKLEMVGMKYANLAQEGKEPAYYGDKVTAEFPHAVLFRWKIDDDKYRVVFGDLTTRDVDAEELAELEALPLNLEPFAIKPVPADGTIGTSVEKMSLGWMSGNGATAHQIYVGTNADEMVLIDEVTTESVELTALEREVTYYWRVDEVGADGTIVAGDVWSFDTGGLVGWWKLDEGSGETAVDSSGNGLDSSIVGDPNWVKGTAGGALWLDGEGDYIDVGTDAALDISGQITVAAWIKVESFEAEWQNIISKGDKSYRLQKFRDQDTLEFACTGVVVPGTQWSNIRGSVSVNDGQWHHVAGTYDGSRMCLYVDGKVDVSSSCKGVIDVTEKSLYIGENSEEPNRFWNGLIDDVRIYNCALSQSDIESLAAERL